MLRDEKWLEYAINILIAVDNGAGSISDVADSVGGSESYIAKVIAILRKSNLIDKKYNLVKDLSEISVRDIIQLTHSYEKRGKYISKVVDIMLDSLDLSVKQLIESHSAVNK